MRWPWGVVLLAMVGCAEIVGADFGDRTLRPGGSDGGSGVGAGISVGGGCPGECVEVPDGWLGPVVLHHDAATSALSCGAVHPLLAETPAVDAYSGPQSQPATCDACTCDAGPVICSGITIDVYPSMAACTSDTPCDTLTPQNGMCQLVQGCVPAAYIKYNGSVSANGSCTPVPNIPEFTVSPPTWDEALRGCAPIAALDGCDDDAGCLPEVGGAASCVYQLADVASCPADFPDRVVGYRDMMDGRGCDDCSCGSSSCNLILIHFGTACMGGVIAEPPGTCVSTGDPFNPAGEWVGEGQCAPGGGAATGSVTAIDPVTYCCRP